MPKVYVRLTPPMREALTQLAQAERRHPSDQAALIIERHLTEQAKTTPKEAVATS